MPTKNEIDLKNKVFFNTQSMDGFPLDIRIEEIAAVKVHFDTYNGVYNGYTVILKSGDSLVTKTRPNLNF